MFAVSSGSMKPCLKKAKIKRGRCHRWGSTSVIPSLRKQRRCELEATLVTQVRLSTNEQTKWEQGQKRISTLHPLTWSDKWLLLQDKQLLPGSLNKDTKLWPYDSACEVEETLIDVKQNLSFLAALKYCIVPILEQQVHRPWCRGQRDFIADCSWLN